MSSHVRALGRMRKCLRYQINGAARINIGLTMYAARVKTLVSLPQDKIETSSCCARFFHGDSFLLRCVSLLELFCLWIFSSFFFFFVRRKEIIIITLNKLAHNEEYGQTFMKQRANQTRNIFKCEILEKSFFSFVNELNVLLHRIFITAAQRRLLLWALVDLLWRREKNVMKKKPDLCESRIFSVLRFANHVMGRNSAKSAI